MTDLKGIVPSPVFLFHYYPSHQHLHSFPTRRSSDLGARAHLGVAPERRQVTAQGDVPGSDQRTARSEEHTSELQSLRHLVCRLLLEKKKRLKQSLTLNAGVRCEDQSQMN